jgi:c(7)-type cytochrome triheme protein
MFQMKKGAQIKMADLNAGKLCGECHNGTKAFKTSDAANCGKCHKK